MEVFRGISTNPPTTLISFISRGSLILVVGIHGKNGFAEVSKNSAKYRSENNLLNQQNNYVECFILGYNNGSFDFEMEMLDDCTIRIMKF